MLKQTFIQTKQVNHPHLNEIGLIKFNLLVCDVDLDRNRNFAFSMTKIHVLNGGMSYERIIFSLHINLDLDKL